MAVYQEKAKTRIKNTIPKMKRIIENGLDNKIKEADTRQVVTRVISDMLGWDEFGNLTGEQAISGGYADFVIQKPNAKGETEKLAVIEVKALGMKLNENHLRQARGYAMDEGIECVILTNGNTWQVYHIEFIRGAAPIATQVFSVKITDPDMKPADKADLFYLISEEAWRKFELKDYAERNLALSGTNLVNHILDDSVLDRIRLAIKKKSGHAVPNHEIAEILIDNVFKEDAIPENASTVLRRLRPVKPRRGNVIKTQGDDSDRATALVCID
jgi:predicted type IV restriction endonuclease